MKNSKQMKTEEARTGVSPIILAVLVLVLAVGAYLLVNQEKTPSDESDDQSAQSTVKPSPRPLLKGREVYGVSQADDLEGPKTLSVEIDPHDPEVGQTQKIVVTTEHSGGTRSVSAVLETDGENLMMDLERVSEDGDRSVWSGEWQVSEEVLYHYILRLNLTGNDGTANTLPITMRDDE